MYVPDRWVVVTITTDGESYQKVFSGWYGGYTGGDSWKMSSGITSVTETEEYIDFMNESGSQYRCYRGAYGLSNYMRSVLSTAMDQQTETAKIEIDETYAPNAR